MNKEVITYIKKGGFWLAEGPVRLQYVYMPARSFANVCRYAGVGWRFILFVIRKQYAYQYLKINETLGVIRTLLKSGRLERNYKLWKRRLAEYDEFENFFEKLDVKKLDNKKLAGIYRKLSSIVLGLWDISLSIEGGGLYGEVLSRKLAEKYKIDYNEANDIINSAGKSGKMSFAAREHIDFLRLVLMQRSRNKNFEKKLREHQKKYFWIENNYKTAKEITADEFRKRIKECRKSNAEIKKEIKELNKKRKAGYKLDKKDIAVLKKFGILSRWMDERKECTLKTNHILHIMLNEIAKRLGLSFDEVSLLFPEEVPLILEGKMKIPSKPELRKRNTMIGVGDGKGMKNLIFIGEEAKKLISFLEKIHSKEAPKKLKGTPTWNFGKIRGIVQIVLDIEKTKFIKGRILVTSMTRPEFVPAMKKAKAVITNEGGMTCHAAIVSRELRIPCIVATRIATKVLKDNDVVEVDADKGVVRKLR